MIVGLILSGMFLGTGAGVLALLSGLSVWSALLLYTVIGSAWVMGGTAIMALRAAMEPRPIAVSSPQRG